MINSILWRRIFYNASFIDKKTGSFERLTNKASGINSAISKDDTRHLNAGRDFSNLLYFRHADLPGHFIGNNAGYGHGLNFMQSKASFRQPVAYIYPLFPDKPHGLFRVYFAPT